MDVITFPENRLTTSGLQILLHGVISLPDAASYDKISYSNPKIKSLTSNKAIEASTFEYLFFFL